MIQVKKEERVQMILDYLILVYTMNSIQENNEIKNIRYGGELIEGRRGASGALVGKYILIQGGITTLGRYLNDLYHYDISNNKMYLSFVE